MNDSSMFGVRLRELRAWRGLSLRTAAGLAGLSFSYWGAVERGEKPVDKRSTLEAMASALRVAPTELSGQPYAPSDPVTSEAHAVVAGVEAGLADFELGERPDDVVARPWGAIESDLDRLNRVLRPRADYAAQGALLPGLLAELHTAYLDEPARRREVMIALLAVYHCAAMLTKNLGVRGLPMLATVRAARVAEELDDPAWTGVVAWLRGASGGAAHRSRRRHRATAIRTESSGTCR